MMIKFQYERQCHIKKFQQSQLTLQKLKDYVVGAFKKIPDRFILTYLDEDNDTIVVAGEKDIQILLQNKSKVIIKLKIQQAQQDFYDQTQQFELEEDEEKGTLIKQQQIKQKQGKSSEIIQLIEHQEQKTTIVNDNVDKKIIFQNVMCDECRSLPIEGNTYYLCSTCGDYAVCQKCQKQLIHEHCLLKIKNPQHSKMKIFVFSDEEQYSIFNQLSFNNQERQKKTEQKQQKKQKQMIDNETIIEKHSFLTAEEQEKKAIQSANYLNQITEINFHRCYKFAKKQIQLSKQQLLQKYINNPRLI